MNTQANNIDAIEAFKSALLSAIETRAQYEADKNASNDSMQSTLTNIHKSVNHNRIAEIMLASNCDANRINRAERVNARYNVYAYEKDVNIARFIASVASLNHYTLAIFKSALALEASDMTLTHKDAVSVCSLSCKSSDAKREAIVKTCKYQKHVAANTASTQSSSSINALQAFSVLTEFRDASNTVSYRVNRDAYATKLLASKLDLSL